MKITLFNSKAKRNQLNKKSYLNKIITMEGALRQSTSLIDPSVNINLNASLLENAIKTKSYVVDNDIERVMYESKSVSIQVIYEIISKCLNANYMYIDEFNRFYFITDIISLANNLWQINAHVDVLNTYQMNILKQSCWVARNENTYDLKIDDSLTIKKPFFKVQHGNLSTYSTPSSSSKVNFSFSTSPSSRNYVCNAFNYNALASYSNITSPVYGYLPNIYSNRFSSGYSGVCYSLNASDVYNLTYTIANHPDYASYVKSLIAFPFEVPSQADNVNFLIGKNNVKVSLTDTNATTVYSQYILDAYKVLADFTLPLNLINDYTHSSDYQKIEIFIPFVGWWEISNIYIGDRIFIYYNIFYEDGSGTVNIYNYTRNELIYTQSVELGVKIGLSSDNTYQIEQQKKANNQNIYLGLLSSAISMGVGYASGNGVAVTGGILSATSNIQKTINSNSMMFPTASARLTSGFASLPSPLVCRYRITTRDFLKVNKSEFGYPLNAYRSLDTLTGYTLVDSVQLEGFESATSTELGEIESLLKNGIII